MTDSSELNEQVKNIDFDKLLRRVFLLGQTYWQQADSESYSQNKKSDETLGKYAALKYEILAAITERDQTIATLRAELKQVKEIKELLSVGFMTCESSHPLYQVKVKFETLAQAHKFHGALVAITTTQG